MSPEILLGLCSLLVSLIVGIGGGFIGSYMGTRVSLAKLETWREVFSEALHTVQGDLGLVKEDCLVHDTELELLMKHVNIARARRQRYRD